MTPIEQDNELREKLDRLIIENQSEDGSIDISDQRAMRDEILELITADRKRVALEARIDEVNQLYNEHLRRWDDDECDIYKNRIAELKAQQEEPNDR